jgi:hypothetical protein
VDLRAASYTADGTGRQKVSSGPLTATFDAPSVERRFKPEGGPAGRSTNLPREVRRRSSVSPHSAASETLKDDALPGFGTMLRWLRLATGLSQEMLADGLASASRPSVRSSSEHIGCRSAKD